ncbi:MAG: YncE family protein [Microbacteriaceae bacterium]|nr:YncE family protein [Microbacteriaceae bacterium]
MTLKIRKKLLAVATAAALTLGMGATAMPAHAENGNPYNFDTAAEVNGNTEVLALDEANNRLYQAFIPSERKAMGEIAWLDTATNKANDATANFKLEAGQPDNVLLSKDGTKLFVSHRDKATISIVDVATGKSQKVEKVTGWNYGMVEDAKTGDLYVWESKHIVKVDPKTLTKSEPIRISTEKDPEIKKVVFDSKSNYLWVLAGKENVLTAYDINTGKWLESLKFDLSSIEFEQAVLGGRAVDAVFDAEHDLLHILVSPKYGEKFKNNRVISFDISKHKTVGNRFIEVGEGTGDIKLNPKTFEIYVTNRTNNTLSVISPETWDATVAVNFGQKGVTEGDGTEGRHANTTGIAVNKAGDKLYVSHPRGKSDAKKKVSVITRTGAAPKFTERKATNAKVTKQEPVKLDWNGPKALDPSKTPMCAAPATGGSLAWGLSQYAQHWESAPMGKTVKTGDDHPVYTWNDAKGWYNAKTGEAELNWGEGVDYTAYPWFGGVGFNYGNPQLKIAADKSATLTFDLKWKIGEKLGEYKRVTAATFKNATVTKDGDNFKFTGTPEFAENRYSGQKPEFKGSFPEEWVTSFDPELRAWWYLTGAGRDNMKPGLPVNVTFTVGAAEKCDAAPTKPETSQPAQGVRVFENVRMDWAINQLLQQKSPLGANYFSAGFSDGDEKTYLANKGGEAATIIHKAKDGTETVPTYATRGSFLENGGQQLVRLGSGHAEINPDGSGKITWLGWFTVNAYGGTVPFQIADPIMTVNADGTGQITALAGGWGTTERDFTKKHKLENRQVVLATFKNVKIDPENGVTINPDYAGVKVNVPNREGVKPQNREVAGWGSWPQSFVDLHMETGMHSLWYTSGGSADPVKAPLPISISFKNATQPGKTQPEPGKTESGKPNEGGAQTGPKQPETSEPVKQGDVTAQTGAKEYTGIAFEWGINQEAQHKMHGGGANYLSAGISAGDEASYQAAADNVRVVHVDKNGKESVPNFASRAAFLQDGGKQLVRIANGRAIINPDGSASVKWAGSFSANYYNGLIPFTITDPVLAVKADGSGELRAKASGYGAKVDNPKEKTKLAEREVVLATFKGVKIDPAQGKISVTPDYAGVQIDAPAGHLPQVRSKDGWGSWPESFVKLQFETGLASYWYTSGGEADARKTPFAFVLDFAGAKVAAQGQPDAGVTDKQDANATQQNDTVVVPAPSAQTGAADKADAKNLANTGSDGYPALLSVAMLTVLAGATLLGCVNRKRAAK